MPLMIKWIGAKRHFGTKDNLSADKKSPLVCDLHYSIPINICEIPYFHIKHLIFKYYEEKMRPKKTVNIQGRIIRP